MPNLPMHIYMAQQAAERLDWGFAYDYVGSFYLGSRKQTANPTQLAMSGKGLSLARSLAEMMESHLRAEPYYRITANVQGPSEQQVSAAILARPHLAGLRGPTIARVYNVDEQDWYSVSLLVKKELLLEAVDHLRDSGAVDIAASQLSYLFDGRSKAFQQLFGDGA